MPLRDCVVIAITHGGRNGPAILEIRPITFGCRDDCRVDVLINAVENFGSLVIEFYKLVFHWIGLAIAGVVKTEANVLKRSQYRRTIHNRNILGRSIADVDCVCGSNSAR